MIDETVDARPPAQLPRKASAVSTESGTGDASDKAIEDAIADDYGIWIESEDIRDSNPLASEPDDAGRKD